MYSILHGDHRWFMLSPSDYSFSKNWNEVIKRRVIWEGGSFMIKIMKPVPDSGRDNSSKEQASLRSRGSG
jgi:hypothetical protein